ncbi:MAG: hypothetical protein AAGC63_09020 [Propionicimonas sp.]|nr:hypothetical protein [Propionicimonas sp.]
MSSPPAEYPDLSPEADAAISDLLAGQPGLPMPPGVRDRITAALAAEAATRAALRSNDADPAEPAVRLAKSVDPVREREDLT